MNNKFLKKFTNNRLLIFLWLIIIISILSIVFLLIKPIKGKNSYSLGSGNSLPSLIMSKNTTYTQTFNNQLDELDEISMTFSTYMIENKSGSLHVIITDENNYELYNNIIELKDLTDNILYTYDFQDIKNSKNHLYTFKMFYEDYKKGDSLAYWYTNSSENFMTINEEPSNQTLSLNIIGKKNDYTIIWYPLLIIAITSSLLSIIERPTKDESEN